MKKIFYLILVIAALFVAIPAFATNTGPPGNILVASMPCFSSLDAANFDTVRYEGQNQFNGFAQIESAYNFGNSLSLKNIAVHIGKSTMLAGLMSCKDNALVSYLRASKYMISFDLRDRKQPMPMDETYFA